MFLCPSKNFQGLVIFRKQFFFHIYKLIDCTQTYLKKKEKKKKDCTQTFSAYPNQDPQTNRLFFPLELF